MKFFISLLCVLSIIGIFFVAGIKDEQFKEDYFRIHIRANSNSQEDQDVKYMVRDAIVELLKPVLGNAETKKEAEDLVKENFLLIEEVANKILLENGFNYKSQAVIKTEYFPTRTYENTTLEAGEYDALIINLGSGTGDNWWCVVYPAFCFKRTNKESNLVYISKIWEIINSVKEK